MTVHRFGEITVQSVSDGHLDVDPASFFPTVSVERLEQQPGSIVDGKLRMPLACFLIRSEGTTVLVDTGLGPHMSRTVQGECGKLPAALERAGVRPADVDVVLFTHLHFDHVGWNCTEKDGESTPTFPNARYLVHRPEWDRWSVEVARYLDRNVRPLIASGRMELVDGDCEPAPGVRLLETPGHTPGHVSVLVFEGGEGAVITGDAAHSPVEIEEPDQSPNADEDPQLSAVSRRLLVERIEAEGLLILGGHFPPPGAGRIVRVEQRRVYRPVG